MWANRPHWEGSLCGLGRAWRGQARTAFGPFADSFLTQAAESSLESLRPLTGIIQASADIRLKTRVGEGVLIPQWREREGRRRGGERQSPERRKTPGRRDWAAGPQFWLVTSNKVAPSGPPSPWKLADRMGRFEFEGSSSSGIEGNEGCGVPEQCRGRSLLQRG